MSTILKSKQKTEQSSDLKLDDVIQSIRNMIDNKDDYLNPKQNQQSDVENTEFNEAKSDNTTLQQEDEIEDNILELTNICQNANHSVTDTIDKFVEAAANCNSKQDEINRNINLDEFTESLMKPLLVEWMNNNLPRIVTQVVATELRKLVPKDKK